LIEFKKLWMGEVLPRVKKATDDAAQKAQKDEIKTEDQKGFLERMSKASNTIDIILKSGKDIWDFAEQHKAVFSAIRKALTWVILS